MEAVTPSEGWGVLHLFYRIDRDRAAADPGGAKRVLDAVEALEADGHQALVSCVLGHKADLGVMALGPDLARLQAFEAELAAAPLSPVWSYLSLTELSEYMSTEEEERERLAGHAEGLTEEAIEQRLEAWRARMAKYREDKLHPRLPMKKLICFYPMSKRREEGANWYSLPYDERRRLMGGHARVGMSYAGRVLQQASQLCVAEQPPQAGQVAFPGLQRTVGATDREGRLRVSPCHRLAPRHGASCSPFRRRSA